MNIVVILGKRLNDDSSMKEELIERIELGIKTFETKEVDYLCICGGAPNIKAGVTEASQMFAYLIMKGFDENRIIAEDKSLTTRGNARYLKKILKDVTIENLYLVSTKYHFFRKGLPKCQDQFKKFFKNANIINVY
ncbi:YdcF family protein [bacterium]|nr:YdcF family protein [bacterium]